MIQDEYIDQWGVQRDGKDQDQGFGTDCSHEGEDQLRRNPPRDLGKWEEIRGQPPGKTRVRHHQLQRVLQVNRTGGEVMEPIDFLGLT